jgi:hypothetical protein
MFIFSLGAGWCILFVSILPVVVVATFVDAVVFPETYLFLDVVIRIWL